MIPALSAEMGYLPPGEHPATWDEIVERFGYTPWRRELLDGLKAALESLRAAGCRKVYLDGSFVTAKERPGDFDACWEAEGVDGDLLDKELLEFDNGRATQKAKYGGELFPAEWGAGESRTPFRAFFQQDQEGNPKGIITIDLQELP
jgi:hypothetical protein